MKYRLIMSGNCFEGSAHILTENEVIKIQEFKKENQTKTIKYINLKEFYSKKKATKEEIEKVYNENKKAFIKEFKSLKFAEINPLTLTETTYVPFANPSVVKVITCIPLLLDAT